MHGAAFFCFGAGGVEEKFLGWSRAVQGAKSSGRGGATVKLGAFSGWGRVVLKIFGAGAVQGSYFSRGRGGAGRASLIFTVKEEVY